MEHTLTTPISDADIEKLRAGAEPVVQFLWSQFPAEVQQRLTAADPAKPLAPELLEALTGELNRVLEGASFYDSARFAAVPLSADTQGLLAQSAPSAPLLLNRLLLEDSYPTAIARRPKTSLWLLAFILGYIACFALSLGPVTWVILSCSSAVGA